MMEEAYWFPARQKGVWHGMSCDLQDLQGIARCGETLLEVGERNHGLGETLVVRN